MPGVHRRQRGDVGDAGAAVDLDGPVYDPGGRAGNGHLGHGDQVPGRLVASHVDDVAGMVAQQPGLLDLDPGLRDLLAHHALVGQRAAEGDPILGPLHQQRQGALGRAEGPHAVVNPPRAEPGLGGREAAALLTDDVRDRHADAGERDLGVAVLVVVAEHGVVADHGDARGVAGDEHHRLLAVRRSRGIGLAHEDEQGAAGIHGAAGPPLAPVDDVLAAIALDPRGDVGGIAAGDVGFGHGEAGPDLPGEQRLEPLPLLLLAAEQVQQLHVAGVGGGAVDRLGRDVQAPAGQFGDRRVLELGQPRLGRQEQVPQALGLGLLLQLLDNRRDGMAVGAGGPAVGQVFGLRGQDPLPHERDHAVLQFAGPGTGGGQVVVKHRILLSKPRARSV